MPVITDKPTPARRKKQAPPSGTSTPPNLTYLIPDASFKEGYIAREIHGTYDVQLFTYARENQKNVLLFGPTGPGKTSAILAAGARDGVPVVTVPCNGAVDANTLFGAWVPTEDGKFVYVESDVTQVIRYGGILYLDEVNFLPPKIAAVLHGLLDKRRTISLLDKQGEVIKASDDLLVVAAYNPDYEGTRPLNPAFRNRFQLKLRFDYDPEIEAQLLNIPVLLTIAQQLRARFAAGDITTPVSTNMLIEFESISEDLGLNFAMENFLSAFHDDERSAVRDALELHSARLETEFNTFME